jgi:glutamate-1-semialdehyde 2,1-aminomutase
MAGAFLVHAHDQGDLEAHHGIPTALAIDHEAVAMLLDGVGPSAAIALPAVDIGSDLVVGHGPHGDAGRGDAQGLGDQRTIRCEHAAAVPGDHAVRGALQTAQDGPCVGPVDGLADRLAIQGDHRVGGEDDDAMPTWLAGGEADAFRFHSGPLQGEHAGMLVLHPLFIGIARHHLEYDAGLAQQRGALWTGAGKVDHRPKIRCDSSARKPMAVTTIAVAREDAAAMAGRPAASAACLMHCAACTGCMTHASRPSRSRTPGRASRASRAVAPARQRSVAALPAASIAGPRSQRLFAEALQLMPGGVNSPVRAWRRLGGHPLVISRGQGAWIEDVDGHRYCDYVLSWGPLLHGHAHPRVVAAVQEAAARGLSFGAPTESENRLAQRIRSAIPSMERLRLVSSGTEATMSAIRVARAATGRDLLIKCDGGYHGHADHLLVAAGSGCATLQQPDSAGVPAAFAALTLSLPYNDLASAERVFRRHRGRIAAFIVEPVAGNMGLVLPRPGYLVGLRDLCTRHGALLIFDEVMTGFRTTWGGYQQRCQVVPDLTCLGKVIGGGLPVGAYGGRSGIMAHLAPEGGCYQAGTLSGNPVAVAAGLATLDLAARRGFYGRQERMLTRLLVGLQRLAARHGVPLQLAQAGTMWGFFISSEPVTDWASAARCDVERWRAFCMTMYRQGVFLAPSPYEACFWSQAHGLDEVRHTLAAADAAFAAAAAL